jgi:hypothetical protein
MKIATLIFNFFKKNVHFFFFILSYLSLFYSFYQNEDGTGNGASGDFKVTYAFILALKTDLLANPVELSLVHTPLHFIIMAFLDNFFVSTSSLRLFYCGLTILLPLSFYLSLNQRQPFNNSQLFHNKNSFLILSAIIFILPAFRYTSIWAADLITSLIFFQVSIFFYLKWLQNKTKYIDSNILFQIFFLAFATYCRQYFAIFFIFFLFIYYQNLNIKSFINLFIVCIFTSLPVIYYVYLFPGLITEQHISIYSLKYFVLGNSSMMSVYLFPLFFINVLFKKITFDKKLFVSIFFSALIVIFFSLFFDPEPYWLGGGVMHGLSKALFNNNYLFLFTSFFTFFIFINFIIESKQNLILLIILLFLFFSFQTYQRYYEPMLFLILFTLIKTDMKNIFLKDVRACYLLFFYYFIYYLGSVKDIIYKI